MPTNFFVHDRGICESDDIGEGTRIWAFSHVMKGARVGTKCNLGEHVFVENRAVIGDGCTIKNGVAIWNLVVLEADVFVGPYVVFTNDDKPRSFIKRDESFFFGTRIKRGATLGANATIVCGVTVGEYAMVGAGAVVTQNIPPHTLVVGNPARPVGRICFCGERLSKDDFCSACQKPLSKNSAADAAAPKPATVKGNHV